MNTKNEDSSSEDVGRGRQTTGTNEREGWVFGRHAILEALAAGRPVERIYLSEDAQGIPVSELRKAAKDVCEVDIVPRSALDRYAHGLHHQGVAARIAMVKPVPFHEWLFTVADKQTQCVLFCDGIIDPGNLGAIIRSAVVFGADAVLLGGKRAPLSPAVAQSSAGCLFHIPIVLCDNSVSTITDLKNAGYWIYATSEHASESILDVPISERIVWVIGSEERGVSAPVIKVVDKTVAIPTAEKMTSLNASVAAGVVLFATRAARMEE